MSPRPVSGVYSTAALDAARDHIRELEAELAHAMVRLKEIADQRYVTQIHDLKQVLYKIAAMEPDQHSRTCCEMHRLANAAVVPQSDAGAPDA